MIHHDADIGGARIHWVEDGVGDVPFVLLHGWGSSIVKWADVIPMLATHRRTIALDLPGFGTSGIPGGSYSPGWLAGSVRAFMDAIGVDRAIVVGNSLGGLVATYLASAWPERCAGLVLAAPAFPAVGPPPSGRALAAVVAPAIPGIGDVLYRAHMRRRAPEVLVAESLARNCADPSRVRASTVRALEEEVRARKERPEHVRPLLRASRRMMWALSARRERTWAIARALRTPTLVLWGRQDALLSVDIGYRAVEEIPGAQLVVLDDCGHNPQIERPEEFSAAVLTFARSLGV
ncbi:MAG: alpha/beta fold hydrolase [Actinomycetota bacterium]